MVLGWIYGASKFRNFLPRRRRCSGSARRFAPASRAVVSFRANFPPRRLRRVSRVLVHGKTGHSLDTLWLLIRGFARVKYPPPSRQPRESCHGMIKKFRVRILKSHHGVRWICIMRHALMDTIDLPSFEFACLTFTMRFNFYRAQGCNRTAELLSFTRTKLISIVSIIIIIVNNFSSNYNK